LFLKNQIVIFPLIKCVVKLYGLLIGLDIYLKSLFTTL